MPTFTAAQVAAYITDNGIKSADYLKVAGQFGVPVSTVVEAMNLMANKDPSIKAASTAYDNAIAANPAQGALNNAFEVSKGLTPTNAVSGTTNTGGSTGVTTSSPTSGLTAAQKLYYDALVGKAGNGTPTEILNYVKGLQDSQALASAAAYTGVPLQANGSWLPGLNTVEDYNKRAGITTPVSSGTATTAGGTTSATNPGKFTAAQVASYIKEQNVPPADYAKTAAMFGIPTDLLNQGVALLTQNDPSVTAATTAYNTAIAANPAQGAANNSWVASQAANTPAQQAATLNAIDTVKSPAGALTQTQGTIMPITDNPGNLTAANVAAYIRDQGVKPSDYAATAEAFGIPMSLLTQGLYLLARNDPSVQATSKAYSDAVAANPAQGTANNAWVAQQTAAAPAVQQNTLGVIDAFKNNAPVTSPSGFTPAQVAAYIRDQKIAPTDYAKTASMFGVDPALLSAGVDLLNANSPQIQTVSDLYKQQIAANPSLGAFNDAWVGAQSAATPDQQQAELGRINAVRTGQPTTTSPIVNPTVGPLTQTTRPPVTAPSTAANSFDTPVLNALYSQQRQNMTSQAPTFDFQAKPQFRDGGLTRVIRGC